MPKYIDADALISDSRICGNCKDYELCDGNIAFCPNASARRAINNAPTVETETADVNQMKEYTKDCIKSKPHEIIDFALKGNVIRFYLGTNGDQWGDDWDDYPYEHNAGEVYDQYITSTVDSYVPFDCFVLEPSDGCWQGDSGFSKQDMIKGKTPCIIIVPVSQAKDSYYDKDFKHWVGCKDAIRVYFGDDITKIQEQIDDLYIDATKGVDER